MSIKDFSLSVQDSTSSEVVALAAALRLPFGSRRRWFVADDLYLCICGVSGSEKFESDVSIDGTESDQQVALFQDAIVLAEHEPLLSCIDHWLGVALDWRPISVSEQVLPDPAVIHESLTGASVDVTLTALDGPERQVELVLTEQRLASMPAFPTELATMAALTWRQIPVDLFIDRFVLGNDDIERLGPGALIVLPASFHEKWLGSVREVTQKSESVGVRIDAMTGGLSRLCDQKQNDARQPESSNSSTTQSPMLNVMLADPLNIDVRQWHVASAAPQRLATSGPLGGQRVRLQLIVDTSVVDNFAGEIVSLGTGYAVRLSMTMDGV